MIGTGVLGGTCFATVLGIFFVPLFTVVVNASSGSTGEAAAAPTWRPRMTIDTYHRHHHVGTGWPAPAPRSPPDYERPAAPVPGQLARPLLLSSDAAVVSHPDGATTSPIRGCAN